MSNQDTDREQLLTKLQDIQTQVSKELTEISDVSTLEQVKAKHLGRKAELTQILRNLRNLDEDSKKIVGQQANKTRQQLDKFFTQKHDQLISARFSNFSDADKIDITLPSKELQPGHIHPTTQMQWKTEDIFQRMGFEVYYPYEIDDDYHNFISVNIPEGHPARDSWDTFWTEDGKIAITHTSSMQNRILKSSQPPIRAIVPGRCFRNEATDARHEHTFHQVEGIYVDKGISFADMLGTLKTFFSEFYETEIELKFSPDFFPFVEPGGMISLSCMLCDAKGCDVCKQTGWLEVLGCGMIHPNVLREANIDPEVYSGFAWGFGLERIVMIKNNIEDVRHFQSGKLKFIRQF